MDRCIQLLNTDDLFEILNATDAQVRGILFGQIHHEFEVSRKASNCSQFKLNVGEFEVDAEKGSGYRLLYLRADGRSIFSEVVR